MSDPKKTNLKPTTADSKLRLRLADDLEKALLVMDREPPIGIQSDDFLEKLMEDNPLVNYSITRH